MMQFLTSRLQKFPRIADRDGAREPVHVLDPIQLLLDGLPQSTTSVVFEIASGGPVLRPVSASTSSTK